MGVSLSKALLIHSITRCFLLLVQLLFKSFYLLADVPLQKKNNTPSVAFYLSFQRDFCSLLSIVVDSKAELITWFPILSLNVKTQICFSLIFQQIFSKEKHYLFPLIFPMNFRRVCTQFNQLDKAFPTVLIVFSPKTSIKKERREQLIIGVFAEVQLCFTVCYFFSCFNDI